MKLYLRVKYSCKWNNHQLKKKKYLKRLKNRPQIYTLAKQRKVKLLIFLKNFKNSINFFKIVKVVSGKFAFNQCLKFLTFVLIMLSKFFNIDQVAK